MVFSFPIDRTFGTCRAFAACLLDGELAVIGVDMDMNGIGEPVKVWTKPGVSKSVLVSHPQTTDDFSSYTLGLQWQF